MEQVNIVFVDLEEDYLMTLVMKFINKLKDNVDITMITDTQYLQTYLEQPQDINILVINEKLYSHAFDRYNIDYIYYLAETTDELATEPTQSNSIYKYSSVSEIYSRVSNLSNLEIRFQNGSSETKLIMVYSPIGGSGKTFTAMGIAKALSVLNKKVLYLNMEMVQNFNYLLVDQSYIQNHFDYYLSTQSDKLMDILNETIRKEGFDYVPPLEQSASALNITMDSYFHLLHQLKEIMIYEYIILDTSTEFNADKAKLMCECDKVFLVTNQDKISLWKLDCFLRNIDYSNRNKFMFLCNAFDASEANMITIEDKPKKYTMTEYIKRIPHKAEGISTANIAENSSFQKIAYYLL